VLIFGVAVAVAAVPEAYQFVVIAMIFTSSGSTSVVSTLLISPHAQLHPVPTLRPAAQHPAGEVHPHPPRQPLVDAALESRLTSTEGQEEGKERWRALRPETWCERGGERLCAP
jgi:hypothetical protein